MSLKPSVFSLRWFDYYFSNDPSALLGRPDGYYDASGTLRRNRNNHLPDADCCHCHNSGCYVINCDEGAAGIFGIILLAGFAIVALCLICLYPPAMIVFWVFMVIGSLAETVAGRDPSCHYVRLYGSVSAGLTLIYIVLILYQVYELQRRYNGYYPGTPGEIIDMPRAIRFFRLNTIMFVLLAICCVPLAITGVCF
ncbi:hypothetical protein EDD86DRAFT_244347 [Gorgonomyces haynaldii]|nr:hypothetical protein EDD86DRAFT_244347 [Gorgonomyces haynaldii]